MIMIILFLCVGGWLFGRPRRREWQVRGGTDEDDNDHFVFVCWRMAFLTNMEMTEGEDLGILVWQVRVGTGEDDNDLFLLCAEVMNSHASICAGGGYLKVSPPLRRGRLHQPLCPGTLFSL